jgi:hypothetical protein
MYLLTTDWHLTDEPANEYRWQAFEHLRTAVMQYRPEATFILGDLVDKKDRFSAAFINRLLSELHGLAARTRLVIMRGNHDTTMRPPNYFEFLNHDDEIFYVNEPAEYCEGALLLLPFSAKPKEDWAGLKLSQYRALFMHATVTGAVVENGTVMDNPHFPILPRRPRIYSGDIHVPQQIANITYVGAPHAIRFGDSYPCRMLLLNKDFEVDLEIPLEGPRKLMVDINDPRDLDRVEVRHGDQIKIRMRCRPDQLGEWGTAEQELADWALARGITIVSTEVVVDTAPAAHGGDPEQSPEQLLTAFAAHEQIGDALLALGLDLLKEAHNGAR